MNKYHETKNNELVFKAYVETANAGYQIPVKDFPNTLRHIIIDYLYEGLIKTDNQVFPAWLPTQIIGLKTPSFFNNLRGWLEGKSSDRKNKHILFQSDGEKILASYLHSHGFIQRQLQLLPRGSSNIDNAKDDSIYLVPTTREIDGKSCYVGLYANEPINENSATAKMIILEDILPGRELTQIYPFEIPKILRAISQQGHPVYIQPSKNSHTTAPQSCPQNRL